VELKPVEGNDRATRGGGPAAGWRHRGRAGAWEVGLAVLLILSSALLFGTQAASKEWPQPYFEGDCPYYISTALSILHDGDLDLRNQLRGGLDVHGRQIALGQSGQWYPKHPILMPIAALPFLALFGMRGFMIFSVVLLAALPIALMRLARPFAPPAAAAGASALLVTGTFLRRYDYNVTPDLFAAILGVVGLLALMRGRDLRGGLVLGISAAAKTTHFFLLPFGLIYVLSMRGGRGVARCAAGAIAPVLALLLLNTALFGSPLVSSYDRNVLLKDGVLTIVSHMSQFDRNPIQGLAGELFDVEHGLVPTSPALWLTLPGLALMFRRHRREAVLALLLSEFYLLLFATYRYWDTTRYGNRFLILVVALASPPLAMALEWLKERAREGMHRRRGAPSPVAG